MTGGRPKQFDEEKALEAAMDLFWRKGFENTSCDDLLAVMDIRAGSMYATFGDKETLYEKAFDLYLQKVVLTGAMQTLNGPGSPLENVRKLVSGWADFMSDPACKGCLVSNTLVEFGNQTTGIAVRAREMVAKKRAILEEKLKEAQASCELSQEANPAELAAFLINTAQGLSAMARSGADEATIRSVVKTTLLLLR